MKKIILLFLSFVPLFMNGQKVVILSMAQPPECITTFDLKGQVFIDMKNIIGKIHITLISVFVM